MEANSVKLMDNDSRWRFLYTKKLEFEIVESFRFFRKRGIEPILIKGWAAARSYPEHSTRYYTDIDLAVSGSDFGIARDLLKSEAGSKIAVDLHRELRHLDTKAWDEIFNDSQEIDLNGFAVRIPSDEDHLRILAVHWLNDGGANKERLWDIYHAVENRPANFDWDLCLNSVSEVRQQWIITAIGLAHKYLSLEIDGFTFADRAKVIPKWLISTIEKEWQSDVRLISLHRCLNDRKELFRQIKKRIPPNALQSTIEMEGRFDSRSRFPYQIGSMLNRILPSIKGIRGMLKLKH